MKSRVPERVRIPHIPIPEEIALAALLRVPRPGSHSARTRPKRAEGTDEVVPGLA